MPGKLKVGSLHLIRGVHYHVTIDTRWSFHFCHLEFGFPHNIKTHDLDLAQDTLPPEHHAMRKEEVLNETEEPLVDTTVAIPIRSKRTERRQKRRQQKEKAHNDRISLLNLPSELVIYILGYLRPSDIFVLSRVSHSLRQFNIQQEPNIATEVIKSRYSALSKCFQLPVLLEKVDAGTHAILQSEKRQELLNIHKKPYQHIKSPDPSLICTCLTCVLAWNNLCVVVDFANWQDNLDANPITPIPIIPRGKYPEWNQFLMSANTAVVHNALHSPLWCVRILEQHLKSTVRAIRRHGNNKGNQRRRFRMAVEDAASESDGFLERSGPPSLDFPFHRDNYYMLEGNFNKIFSPGYIC